MIGNNHPNAVTGQVGPPRKPREEAAGVSFREGREPNIPRERSHRTAKRPVGGNGCPVTAQSARAMPVKLGGTTE